MTNTVVHVKTQEQWNIVSEYYGYDWKLGDWRYCKENSGIMLDRKAHGNISLLDSTEYKIISFEEWRRRFMAFKMQDLKSGMIVELRNGCRYLVAGENMANFYSSTSIYNYNEDLEALCNPKLDIVKVYKAKHGNLDPDYFNEHLELIWERDENIEITTKNGQTIKITKDKARELGFEVE